MGAITITLTISIALGILGLVLGFVLNAVFQRNQLGTQRREAEEQIRQQLEKHLSADEGRTLSEIRELLGTTRKFAVPLCEYFDEIGFTRRDGSLRYRN